MHNAKPDLKQKRLDEWFCRCPDHLATEWLVFTAVLSFFYYSFGWQKMLFTILGFFKVQNNPAQHVCMLFFLEMINKIKETCMHVILSW